MKKLISTALTSFLPLILISNCISQDFTFSEKELVKKLKIKSKSMYYDIYRDGFIDYSSNQKDLHESCLFDANGNKSEDYPPEFNGPFRKNNYYYDIRGNLIKTVTKTLTGDTVLYSREYEYDSWNNLISENFFKPRDTCYYKIIYKYNSLNKLILKTNSSSTVTTFKYEYDRMGNLINTIEKNSFENEHSYKKNIRYDLKGRIIEVTGINSDYTVNNVNTFIYDDSDNKIEENLVWKDKNLHDRKMLYSYDSDNKMVQYVYYEGEKIDDISRFIYDTSGLLIEKRHYSSNGKLASVYRYVYEYY